MPPKLERVLDRADRDNLTLNVWLEDNRGVLDKLAKRLIYGISLSFDSVSTVIIYALNPESLAATGAAGALTAVVALLLWRSFRSRRGVRTTSQFTRQNLKERRREQSKLRIGCVSLSALANTFSVTTEWRTAFVGVCFAARTESFVYAMTGQFTLVGGVTGSALADHVVDIDSADGGWHGLMAGVVWGCLLMSLSVLLTFLERTSILLLFQHVIPLVETPGELTTAIVLALALPNVASGALGGRVRRDATGTWFDPEMAEVNAVEGA